MRALAFILSTVLVMTGCIRHEAVDGAPLDDRAEILRALEAFPDFSETGVKLQELDIQDGWALAYIEPARVVAEGGSVLLRKDAGRWSVLVYGSSLYGVGEEHGVPADLAEDWGL